MSSIANGSDGDGDTETSPNTGPKTNHNRSIVYIDHDLDKAINESTDDETAKNTSHPNLTVVYIDHHLDDSISSDTGAVIQNQQGLFRLPPELRIMIWELLLPGKRLLRARAWFGRDRRSRLDDGSSNIKVCQGRWNFRVSDWLLCDVEGDFVMRFITPTVLKICKESRIIALWHGFFIFGQRGSQETGTWWNPDLDVLGFDSSWDMDQHPWALAQLDGLEHVKHVAIDERQAWTVCYDAGYNGEDPLDIPRELREPLAVTFEFRASDDRNHYILEFFPHFQQLSILFTTMYNDPWRLWGELHGASHRDFYTIYILEDDAYSVTFRLGSDIEKAVKELEKYRELCMQTEVKEPLWDYLDRLVEGPVYSVKDDDLDIYGLDHWMRAGFSMCQTDQEVPI